MENRDHLFENSPLGRPKEDASLNLALRAAVLSACLGVLGCASEPQNNALPTAKTYSVSADVPLPVLDPSLITLEEVAAISSDRITSDRLHRFIDELEIADGNLRMHRIFISRETSKSLPNPQELHRLNESKKQLEQEAQQAMSRLLSEVGINFPFSQVRFPASFQMQTLFDAEEQLRDRPGDLNTFLIHQLRQEEIKLRHLRLMIYVCGGDGLLTDEERSFYLNQIAVSINRTEASLQLLHDTFNGLMR